MVNLIIKKVYNVEDGEKLTMCLIIFTGSAHFKFSYNSDNWNY
jgi:hypothetical protein